MRTLATPSFNNNSDSARPRILIVEVLGAGDSEDVRIEHKKDERKKDDRKGDEDSE
jgi:hypothetical protein